MRAHDPDHPPPHRQPHGGHELEHIRGLVRIQAHPAAREVGREHLVEVGLDLAGGVGVVEHEHRGGAQARKINPHEVREPRQLVAHGPIRAGVHH